MDKEGRSVPAPGQGILSTAKEVTNIPSLRLDLSYRKKQLEFRRNQIGTIRQAPLSKILSVRFVNVEARQR
jgi:hypothetical protein